ncbi:MAG: DUF3007 family protein [Thermostichales cyanobacterium SZTDM-1c_bins_54]
MRRLDVIGYSLVVLLAGGLLYGVLQGLGQEQAGILTGTGLTLGLLVWVVTYLRRVLTGKMTLKAQREAFQIAHLAEQLEKLTPEERQALEEEIRQEKL